MILIYAYPLQTPCVPLGVRVPQVENRWFRVICNLPLTVLPRQRPASQLHDPKVLLGADQLVRQDPQEQTRRGRSQNEQTRKRTRKIEGDGRTGYNFEHPNSLSRKTSFLKYNQFSCYWNKFQPNLDKNRAPTNLLSWFQKLHFFC